MSDLQYEFPMESSLVGFWPLTDHHEGLEGYGKLSSLNVSGFEFEHNSWLNRPVVSGGTGVMSEKRLFSSVSIYQVDFTIVFHVEMGTTGPVIEWEDGRNEIGLSIGMLPDSTVRIVGLDQYPIEFPNCVPTNYSIFPGHETYRVAITYNYTAGIVNVWANDQKCNISSAFLDNQDDEGNVLVGTRSVVTMAGFKIRSSIDKPLNRSFDRLKSKWFCLFIFDAIVDSNQFQTLSQICKDVSDVTPRYGGVNNMLYKPYHLRGFWPLGRDLGGIDISGRDHHGEIRQINSWSGPTGLPYSASHFLGYPHVSHRQGQLFTRRDESFSNMINAHSSVSISCWFFVQPHWTMGLVGQMPLFSMGDTDMVNNQRDIEPVNI